MDLEEKVKKLEALINIYEKRIQNLRDKIGKDEELKNKVIIELYKTKIRLNNPNAKIVHFTILYERKNASNYYFIIGSYRNKRKNFIPRKYDLQDIIQYYSKMDYVIVEVNHIDPITTALTNTNYYYCKLSEFQKKVEEMW